MSEKEIRKIFNYKSIVLTDKTLEEEGYHPDKFGRTSSKFIWARCRYCGKPHRIRKGFYNKAESACHKECRIKEQKESVSPFSKKEVREKSAQTNLERYGHESASSSKEIKNKISKTKLTQKSKNKTTETNQGKYGVDNVFQSEEIKEKIRNTNIEKYDCFHHMQNENIKEKTRNTCFKKYGVDNISHVENFEKHRKTTFNNSISENKKGNYDLINILRSEDFWKMLEHDSLKNISDFYNINYNSLASTLSKEEFRERYYSIYSFPRQQKQKEVSDFIKSLGVNVCINDRSVISPLELDIFVPDHNFAIEFNGSYWHSESVLNSVEARNKHLTKTKLCLDRGVRLVHIFERDWETKTDQYKSFIKCILGFNEKKYNARSCEVTKEVCSELVEKWHVQGCPNFCLKSFSLRDKKDGIVGNLIANKHHRQGFKNDIILSRLCFAPNSTVRGGASRLFSNFKKWSKENGYDRIISWSDNCYTQGGIYNTLGFKLDREYGPDYFYWDMNNNKYLSKQSQQKKNTGCPKNTTEREWGIINNMYRIYDCGKKRWIYDL